MPRHTVTATEFAKWACAYKNSWVTFASSYGQGSDKELTVAFSDTKLYRVVDHGKEVYMGSRLAPAIGAYNKAE